MRKLLAAFCLFASFSAALAQDAPVETVTVNGRSLIGVWHGGLIQYGIWSGFFSFLSAPKLQGVADAFCRIAPQKDELEMSCLQFGGFGPVTVDGSHVHFGRSRGDGSSFDGELLSPAQLRGHYQIRRWGIAHENPVVSNASRVTPDPAAPDKAGKAALLRRILSEGLSSVPQDEEAMKKNGPVFSLPELGAVQAIAYLGQEAKWDPLPPGFKLEQFELLRRPDFFSVYLVSFAEGERLCGLHQRDDGLLDALRCA